MTAPTFYIWQTRRETWGGAQRGGDEWYTPGQDRQSKATRPRVLHGSGDGDQLICLTPQLAWYAAVQYWYGFGHSQVERELRIVSWTEKDGLGEVVAQKWLGGADADLTYPASR